MSLSSLNSVFAPSRDYTALLAVMRKSQSPPDDPGSDSDHDTLPVTRIFLPAGLALDSPSPSSSSSLDGDECARGKFRSEVVWDPVAHTPWDVALERPELVEGVEFGAFEQAGEEDVFYSRPGSHSDPDSENENENENESSSESESESESKEDESEDESAPLKPNANLGVIADVALANRWHRGIKTSRGEFQMRRAWVGQEGVDEVFEGFFFLEMEYSGYYRGKRPEDGWEVKMPFWAVRARGGEEGDGEEERFWKESGGGGGRRGYGMCQYDFGCY